jgi:hypothetical protein
MIPIAEKKGIANSNSFESIISGLNDNNAATPNNNIIVIPNTRPLRNKPYRESCGGLRACNADVKFPLRISEL